MLMKEDRVMTIKGFICSFVRSAMVYYVDYCDNATYPCRVDRFEGSLYYIPYKYESFIGPEKWWDDGDTRVSLSHRQFYVIFDLN